MSEVIMMIMEKLMMIVLVMFVVYGAEARGQRHHPKFPDLKKEVCTRTHEIKRNEIIEEASCGAPRDVFVELQPGAAHVQMKPGAVWVKRCVGLCPETESNCVALETRIRQIPVRIMDVKTNKASCSWYPVEEHVRCGCCYLSAADCGAPKVYNPRKCSCQCPNIEDRRDCKKTRDMRWNRSKCICELKSRPI